MGCYPIEDCQSAAAGFLLRLGYEARDAAYIAEHVVACEVEGLIALGLRRLPHIAALLREGYPTGNQCKVSHSGPAFFSVSGGGGVGYLPTRACVEWALDALGKVPVVVFTAQQFFFNGALRIYGRCVADAGYVCLLASSSAPAAIAPNGGTTPIIGTNPLCIAVPGKPDAVIFDSSMSTVTWSTVASLAADSGRLPEGAALDQHGEPTTSAARALNGSLLTWGGERGFALGLLVQCLGLVAGSPPVATRMADCGLIGVAFDPAVFGSLTDLSERQTRLETALRHSSAQARLPGTTWSRKRAESADRGITVDSDLWRFLTSG